MQKKRTTEAPVKDRVKEVLAAYGVQYDMPVPIGYGKAGNFDFVCCVSGAYLGIETKRDDKEMPTTLQSSHADEVRDAGGVTLLIHKDNVGLVAETIREMRRRMAPVRIFYKLGYWPDVKPQLEDTDDAPIVRKRGKS